MNTWVITLIGLRFLNWKLIWKPSNSAKGVPIIVMKVGNKFLKKTKYVLFSGVKLSLRIQGWVLKNARGSALSANPAVLSIEKCEKNDVER